jgi:acyl-homoserine-lactone acylase
MRKLSLALSALSPRLDRRRTGPTKLAALEQRAKTITITRDDWGIPHIKGKTDADAVFGLVYAQAEDDFNRVETNFINSMGDSPRRRVRRRSIATSA